MNTKENVMRYAKYQRAHLKNVVHLPTLVFRNLTNTEELQKHGNGRNDRPSFSASNCHWRQMNDMHHELARPVSTATTRLMRKAFGSDPG